MRYFNLALTLVAFLFISVAVSKVSAQYTPTDFIVAGCVSGNVAVLNSSLSFQNNLATSFGCAAGLDLLINGNIVAASHNNQVRFYNSSGTLVSSFTNSLIGDPIDVKVWMNSNLFFGTNNGTPISDFTTSGVFVRTIGAVEYDGIAVLPGNVLWAGGPTGIIDVFDIPSGTLTSTITLDNGQQNAEAMHYSGSTNTVLMTDSIQGTVYERTTTGAFVRQFIGGSSQFGVTRGPGGDVFATDCFSNQINRWTATGTFLGSTATGVDLQCPANIIWVGNTVITAANVSVSGRVFTQSGNGLPRATVYFTDNAGNVRTARTNPFGYYSFEEVEVGATYVFGVISKSYQFAPRVVTINEDLTELNFTPQE